MSMKCFAKIEGGGGDEAETVRGAVRDCRALPAGPCQEAGVIHRPRHSAGDTHQGPAQEEQRHQV